MISKEPKTIMVAVADLFEMQFEDGTTCAFHTGPEKAIQWLAACDGNKIKQYVTLERFQEAISK